MKKTKELQHEFEQALKLNEGPELTQLCSLLSSKLANSKISLIIKDELEQQLHILNSKDKNYKKKKYFQIF